MALYSGATPNNQNTLIVQSMQNSIILLSSWPGKHDPSDLTQFQSWFVHMLVLSVFSCVFLSICILMVCLPVVVELGAELDTESVLRWKQDILNNIKGESDDTSNSATVPFLLVGSKQDKVRTLLV